jgi:23S rRNA (adenine2503-C2)-methyltransferase
MATAVPNRTVNLYDLTYPDLVDLLAAWGHSAFHADRLWNYLYRQQVVSLAEMVELRPELRLQLEAKAVLDTLSAQVATDSSDGFTKKCLLRLIDGQTIETVLMMFKGRATACVSTQVGCAMGCVFCATGQMGFTRHLSPGEIVAQALHVSRILNATGKQLRNVVLMGMAPTSS